MKRVALFGPGNVIYPLESDYLEALSKGSPKDVNVNVNVTVLECKDLSQDSILSRLKSPTLLGGPRAVILRDFFKADLGDLSKISDFFKKDTVAKGLPDLVILEDDSPPSKRHGAELLSSFHEVRDLSLAGLNKKERLLRARSMVESWLEARGMRMSRDAMEFFLNTVDVSYAAFIHTELEKIVTAMGKRDTITLEDVSNLAISTRQEEIYTLTESLAASDREGAIRVLNRLIDQGVHPLAILQVLSTWLLRILILKLVFTSPPQDPGGISFDLFKKRAIPRIEEELGTPIPWPLSGLKPYALYSLWKASLNFYEEEVRNALESLTDLDIALKQGSAMDRLHLELFIMRMTEI